MPKIAYKECNFRSKSLGIIKQCNAIIAEYTADNLQLTLRQLYYQLVSRDIIPNNVKEYNNLGNIVNDARLAGLIDWNAIEDRTRSLASMGHWNSPQDIIEGCDGFRIDKWKDQPCRAEVWIEKEALAGIFDRICTQLDVPYLSCRGYTSQSEMWGAAMRFVKYIKAGKNVRIFHFGDHDPSGIDMTRDIEDRLKMFVSHHVGFTVASKLSIKRIALNMDQVREYDPPENPAKTTDTRFAKYLEDFGESSWELDALNPRVLAALVRGEIKAIRDESKWSAQLEKECEDRAVLRVLASNWEKVERKLNNDYSEDIETEKIGLIESEQEVEDD
jgi:hypothetical protein